MEFFIVANSKAAPIVSDTSHFFAEGETAAAVRDLAVAEYDHPAGLYALNVYASADAYHKKQDPLAVWRSPEAMKQVVR